MSGPLLSRTASITLQETTASTVRRVTMVTPCRGHASCVHVLSLCCPTGLYEHTQTHTNTHERTPTRMHTHKHSHKGLYYNTHTRTRTHAHTHTHTQTHIHTRAYTITHTRTHTQTHTHARTHAHTHSLKGLYYNIAPHSVCSHYYVVR